MSQNILQTILHDETGTLSAALDMFSPTQGAIIYRGASGWVGLGPGSSGQVFTSGGPSANPSWGAAGNFSGPGSSVANNIVTFADATGKVGKDSGVAISSLSALAGLGTAVAGDVIYASAAGVWARLAKGTGLQALLMNSGATAPQWSTLPFTQAFESAQQTITSAGSLTLAHGLGVKPKLYLPYIQCTTADLNYAIGDEVCVAGGEPRGFSFGVSIVPDATNLNIRYGSGAAVFAIPNKTTGSGSGITIASWRFVVRAWV